MKKIILKLFILLLTISTYAEEYKIIKGTSIAFIPLLDFEKAVGYTGFESIKYQTSIMVMQLPAYQNNKPITILDLDNLFNEYTLESKGIILKHKQNNPFNLENSLLIEGIQTHQNETYHKLIYLFIGDNKFAQVIITCPKTKYNIIKNDLINMLKSFRWTEKQKGYQTFYKIDLPENWKIALQMGPIDMYTKNGIMPGPKIESIAIYNLQEEINKNEFKKYVKNKNLKRNYFSELEIIKNIELSINNFP